jgi:hypothetical protein
VHTGVKQLRAAMAEFIEFYDQRRYREGIGNVRPADVCQKRLGKIMPRMGRRKVGPSGRKSPDPPS